MKLLWDQIDARLFETGLDRGVLYLRDGSGVPWNGLTSLDESFGEDDAESVYFDGVKRQDRYIFGSFVGTLTAFTYPDEFLEYEGSVSLGNGLYVDDQRGNPFGLSYRGLIGNATEGSDYGYELHILYNLTADPTSYNYETLNETPNPIVFSWDLTSVPQHVDGFRPTAHVKFNSRDLDPLLLEQIENILYGTDATAARLPTINELIALTV